MLVLLVESRDEAVGHGEVHERKCARGVPRIDAALAHHHGDAEVQAAQRWLQRHFSVASPVDEMTRRSKLSERTLKRRFMAATGLAPLDYVQRLRVEDAKRRLERTDDSVDDIAWRVGYEDPAFFRRLFRRVVGMAPGAYRKRFSIPDFARTPLRTSAD